MKLPELLDALFPQGRDIQIDQQVLTGVAQTAAGPVTVMGTTDHAEIGVEHALALAETVLASTRDHPQQPIVMLVDTAGQRPSRRDELLAINGYLAHLAQCLDVARRRGARLISLVYSEAVSGGFLSFGLMADRIYALPAAQVRVMDFQAMARVTKQPVERLRELSQSSPVFAPGVENYVAMGGVHGLWQGDLAAALVAALREPMTDQDERASLGQERGGRLLAAEITARVRRGET